MPRYAGRSSTPAATQLANRLGLDKRGIAVAAQLAMTLDLFPVDVDVGQLPLVQRVQELLIALAAGQNLDDFRVEDRIEGHRVLEVEHRRLPDEQGMGVCWQFGVESRERSVPASGNVSSQEDEVARPFVEASQGGRDIGEIHDQGDCHDRARRTDQPRFRAQSAPSPASTASGGKSGSQNRSNRCVNNHHVANK